MNKLVDLSLTLSKLMLVITFSFFIWGCKHAVKFAYIKYDSVTINTMMRSDATHFIVQPHTSNAADAGSPFRLVSYISSPGRAPRGSRSAAPDTLETESDSTISFSGKLALGNNVISRNAIIYATTDDSDKPIPFAYIRLRPFLDKNRSLAYELFAVDSAGKYRKFKKPPPHSDPCPPIPCN